MEPHILPGYRLDPTITIVTDHVRITSFGQILQLDIIDWNRLNGYWDNTFDALQVVADWLTDVTEYAILRTSLKLAPERADWPGWKHVGDHVAVGRLFWNWFHWKKRGTLVFADSPDFSGTLELPHGKTVRFWGDIGKVSPSTFLETIKRMDKDDIWISIPDVTTQIVLEPLVSFRDIWRETMNGAF